MAWFCWHQFSLFCMPSPGSGPQRIVYRSSLSTRTQTLVAGLLGAGLAIVLLCCAVLLSIIATIVLWLKIAAQTCWSWTTSDPLVVRFTLGKALPTGYFSSLRRNVWFYIALLSFVFFIPWVCLWLHLLNVPLDGLSNASEAYQELWEDHGLRCCGGVLLCSSIVSFCLANAYSRK